MLEASGVKTGINTPKLLALGQQVTAWLAGEQANGTLCGAALSKNFKAIVYSTNHPTPPHRLWQLPKLMRNCLSFSYLYS
jgi:hypothetical protein